MLKIIANKDTIKIIPTQGVDAGYLENTYNLKKYNDKITFYRIEDGDSFYLEAKGRNNGSQD